MRTNRPFLLGLIPQRGAAVLFGSLERRILELVWAREESSVREVQAALGSPLAYTTVMTTLDRLYKKGVLLRRKSGRAYLYSAAMPREDLQRFAWRDLLRDLLAEGPLSAGPLLSTLVEALGSRDRMLLGELERLVREKRRELDRKGGV